MFRGVVVIDPRVNGDRIVDSLKDRGLQLQLILLIHELSDHTSAI